uniref:THO complex subunit 7 n=3 Tax=Lygus hesperus TaxID=30085 RepID=A0A0A9XN42_LYGHE
MNEEEVIRQRLLIDGDGTGDERRINHLLKKFMKWSSREDDAPDVQVVRDQILSQVAQCEYAFLKSRLTAAMTDSELENYDNLSNQIDSEISNIKEAILSTKEDLKEAKIIRKNRLECEVLIKVIKEQPDRKETNEKLSNLKGEISSLEERYEALERKLDMRRKQFYVMFTSLHHLQSLLDSDSNDPMVEVMDVETDSDVVITDAA